MVLSPFADALGLWSINSSNGPEACRSRLAALQAADALRHE